MMVDVDSTLYDADKLFYKLAMDRGITTYPRKSYQWFRAGELGVSQETLTNLFRAAHSREEVEKLTPFTNSVEVLTEFMVNHPAVEIHYVSSRNARAEGPLRDWIIDQGYPLEDDAHVVATMDKKGWLMANTPAIVIDDRVQTIIFSRFQLDAYVLSLKHSHNINLTNEIDGVYMCDDWTEIGQALEDPVMKTLEVTRGRTRARA
jgi:hypothetical protein